MKKQKVEGGAAVPTAIADKTELTPVDGKKTPGRPKKRKRSRSKNKFKNPCHEMPQFIGGDFQCVLNMYINKKNGVGNTKLVFKTTQDIEIKLPGYPYYVSTCNAGGLTGKGRSRTKKQSRQRACLKILQTQGLVPKKSLVDTMAVTLPKAQPKKAKKPVKPIITYKMYLEGNFKGALEKYLKINEPTTKIIVKSETVFTRNVLGEFATTCETVMVSKKFHGLGQHTVKRKSIQLSYLDCMLNMELLTQEEHLEKHPPVAEKEEVVEKQDLAGKEKVVEKQDPCESAKVQPVPDNQNADKLSKINGSENVKDAPQPVVEKQNADEPTKIGESEDVQEA